MRPTSPIKFLAVFFAVAAAVSAGHRLVAADQTSSATTRSSQPRPTYSATRAVTVADPGKCKAATAAEKWKDLGDHLKRALDIAVDLFSGNKAELLSRNRTALLSGNSPAVLSGNNPKVLSENTTPILSGNTLSLFSNIKVEIHIENSGNSAAGGAARPPRAPAPGPEPRRTPTPPRRG